MSAASFRSALPLATGDFRKLRRQRMLYVDKTRRIADLVRPPNQYVFLARPRRFGKSLLVSTLEALFKGERELFAGTWIHDGDWPWEAHAVLRLDMTGRRTGDLETSLRNQMTLLYQAQGMEMPVGDWSASERLEALIKRLAQDRRVVVLIDEYDAPIHQNLERPDLLPDIRDTLRLFYGMLKVCDADLHFVFLTGVTRFARTSVFSGLNNLMDVSFEPVFSDLLGFTQEELDRCLAPYVKEMAQAQRRTASEVRQAMRAWYDGYLFAEDGVRVYNPYSTLYSLHNQRLDNYWAESGAPVFLTRLIVARRSDLRDLVGQKAKHAIRAFFRWEEPNLLAAMYQTGYLTLARNVAGSEYELVFPNREVEQTFAEALLDEFIQRPGEAAPAVTTLGEALQRDDYDAFFQQFNALLQRVPHPLQTGHPTYCQLFLHLAFILLGHDASSERSNYRGRMDTVVEMTEKVVVWEYKVNGTATAALEQLEAKGYHHEFLGRGKRIVGVGVNFDREARQATEWLARVYETG